MLETPFGKIKIIIDGIDSNYEATPFDYIKPPIKDNPIDGCYRIHIPVKNAECIQCTLEMKSEDIQDMVCS